jgi:hypothetical protein
MPGFVETIEVTQNLEIIARERGKIVDRREGHNIFLDVGREYLAEVIALTSLDPDTPERNDRVKYMGMGIGGSAQQQLAQANAAPLVPAYAGTNAQTDTDPLVTTLERPVRISGSSTAYPGIAGDAWVGAIQTPATHATPREVTFRRLFGQGEISYSPFISVPVCEVGLFTSNAVPTNFQNIAIAYDTFATLTKTAAIEIEVVWTIRFS